MSILDQYVKKFPTYQNAIDIFKGEWSSKLPPPHSELVAGQIPLFQDSRIIWAEEQLNGFKSCKVLELGPLEGGHTYMLEQMGAQSILAIEANSRAYLKCLITKEILNLKKARFLLGDFITYLKNTEDFFDICIASGVLYHMQNPAELIQLISQKTTKLMIWTHYYDQALIKNNPHIPQNKFSDSVASDHQGFKHTLYRQNYHEALQSNIFCGGTEHFSMWMPKQDILACLTYFGFKELKINFDSTTHPNGPCFCVIGFKSKLNE